MRIKKFSVQNYKSWRDSGEIEFDQGINIIVGQNNVGKTALLEAVALRARDNPYNGLRDINRPHLTEGGYPSCQMSLESSTVEYRRALSEKGHSNLHLPINPQVLALSDLIESYNGLFFTVAPRNLKISYSNSIVVKAEFSEVSYDGSLRYLPVKFTNGQTFEQVRNDIFKPNQADRKVEIVIAQELQSLIFMFNAERFNVSSGALGNIRDLNSNCQNLAQVLNYLQTENPRRFLKFNELVSKVFPQIKQITVPPVSVNQGEISIWLHDPESERADLAIPLSKSGTGIGQVLAMLYVVVNSDQPQVILIDEPQSFLHPGAIRSLIEIFQMYDKHQYILSTHTPAILSMVSAPVFQITHDGFESRVKRISHEESKDTTLILEDLGAKLSDVFGADRVIWVEGLTEENCFKKILKHFHKGPVWGTQIIGVRATGDFSGRNSKMVYDVYTKLSKSSALLPQAIGFIFDSELLDEKSKNDIIRESKGLVHFLPRRMYECYLVDLDSIASLLNQCVPQKTIERAQVEMFILKEENIESVSQEWLVRCNAAKLLNKIFKHFSDGTIEYQKIKHGTLLTESILNSNSEQFREIYDIISRIIKD